MDLIFNKQIHRNSDIIINFDGVYYHSKSLNLRSLTIFAYKLSKYYPSNICSDNEIKLKQYVETNIVKYTYDNKPITLYFDKDFISIEYEETILIDG